MDDEMEMDEEEDEQPGDGKRYQAPWTEDQVQALWKYVRKVDKSGMRGFNKMVSTRGLANRAFKRLVPKGVVGPRSRLALRNKIRQLREAAERDPALFDYAKWTQEQCLALEEFIKEQEEAAEGSIAMTELARRALAQLVPTGVIGPRSECSLQHRMRFRGDSCEDEEDEIDED